MERKLNPRRKLLILTAVLIGCCLYGCGGESHSNSTGAGNRGMGTMSVSLTDAPVNDWKAIYVTIGRISVCAEPAASDGDGKTVSEDGCNWKVVAAPGETYNLLELVNGVTESLGETELAVGTYRRLRLTLKTQLDAHDEAVSGFNMLGETHPYANYAIDLNDKTVPLRISKSLQTGILLQSAFQVEENKYTELLLDFDAGRSIVMTADGDAFQMKPVIRVVDMKEMVRVAGTVSMMSQVSNELAIEPAHVSAQYLDDAAGPVIEAATATDDAGAYQLLLEKNKEYSIVVVSNSYAPACDFIATFGEEDDLPNDITRNFILDAAEVRPLKVEISGTTEGSEVDVSIRQNVEGCSSGDPGVEVIRKRLLAGAGGDLSLEVTLPVNKTYTIVTSSGAKTSSGRMTINPGEGYQETTLFLGQ
jgi:hypothetical protein